MKITVQEKIAELERRIVALESQRFVTTKTTTTVASKVPDLDAEVDSVWKSFDTLFKKAFSR